MANIGFGTSMVRLHFSEMYFDAGLNAGCGCGAGTDWYTFLYL